MSQVTDGLVHKTEIKAVAAPIGGGIGGALTTLGLYLLGVFAFGADATANSGADAVAAVPLTVSGPALVIIPAAFAYYAAYRAPHTSRTVVELPPVSGPTASLHAEAGSGDLSTGETADGGSETSLPDDDTV